MLHTCTGLSKHEVIRAEDLTEGTSSHRVHGSRLQVNQHSTGDILSTSGLIVVNVDPLELQVGVSVIRAGGINTMLIRDDLPELSTNLVATLASLDVNNFSHDVWKYVCLPSSL